MEETLNDYWFNPALFADIITTDTHLYTQDQLMEMIKWIIKYADRRFQYEWEGGQTSKGLLLASALNERIDILENPEKYVKE